MWLAMVPTADAISQLALVDLRFQPRTDTKTGPFAHKSRSQRNAKQTARELEVDIAQLVESRRIGSGRRWPPPV